MLVVVVAMVSSPNCLASRYTDLPAAPAHASHRCGLVGKICSRKSSGEDRVAPRGRHNSDSCAFSTLALAEVTSPLPSYTLAGRNCGTTRNRAEEKFEHGANVHKSALAWQILSIKSPIHFSALVS